MGPRFLNRLLKGTPASQVGQFSTVLVEIRPDLVAVEDQWLGPNFQGVKALIAHRGALAGVAALFGYQVEVVNTGSWQSRIGARRGTRRDAIKRLSMAFARRVTGLEFGTQDEADAACIAITTWDSERKERATDSRRR